MMQMLTVYLGEEAIGTLIMLASGSVFFQFNENYQQQDKQPVLSQSFYRLDGSLITEMQDDTRAAAPLLFEFAARGVYVDLPVRVLRYQTYK